MGTPAGLVLVVTEAHWPPLPEATPVVLAKPTLLMVVTVGAALLDVKSVAWYSMSFCVAVD